MKLKDSATGGQTFYIHYDVAVQGLKYIQGSSIGS